MAQQEIPNRVVLTTPTQQKLRDKLITAKQWADMVKSGDWINRGGPGSDTIATIEALCARFGDGPNDLKDIEIWTQGGMMIGGKFFLDADWEGKYHVNHEQFLLSTIRNATSKGYGGLDWKHWSWSDGMDSDFARFYRKSKEKRVMDWGLQACAVPHGGYVNAGYGPNNFLIVAKTCKKFVCEIREDYAWCEGGRGTNIIRIEDVDYFVEVDIKDPKYQWPYVNEKSIEPGPVAKSIAEHIMGIMRDGDCIQVGIGELPSAVVIALKDSGLKHIGLHTEMIGEYAFTLAEAGVLDNSRKSIDQGRCAWAYAMPFDVVRYWEWMHRNPFFAAYDVGYTNNIVTLSQIDNFISINNFAQIDLRGQVASSNVGGRPISGTGGQFQFIVGASLSKGGRGVLAATARDAKGRSRIVPRLEPGSVVSVPSWLVSYVATEYGIVNIMGCTDAETARKLISIAHPDDREELEKAAYEMGLKPKHWMFNSCPDRRYPTTEELKDHKYAFLKLKNIPAPIAVISD